MTPYVVISLLAGMALGQRFKVLILAPVMALALIAAIATGIARSETIWAISLLAAATVTSLQFGYLAGTGMRHFVTRLRRGRERTVDSDLPPVRRPIALT